MKIGIHNKSQSAIRPGPAMNSPSGRATDLFAIAAGFSLVSVFISLAEVSAAFPNTRHIALAVVHPFTGYKQ